MCLYLFSSIIIPENGPFLNHEELTNGLPSFVDDFLSALSCYAEIDVFERGVVYVEFYEGFFEFFKLVFVWFLDVYPEVEIFFGTEVYFAGDDFVFCF